MKLIQKNTVELNKMRAAGRLAAEVLDYIQPHVIPGATTLHLNDLCHAFIEKNGAIPAPLGYKGYPKATCISVDNVICHGIPSASQVLQEGQIVNIDITVIKDGFHGDTSRMYTVGKVNEQAKKLILTTYQAMMAGIETVHSGSFLHTIGHAIENIARPAGFSVVQDYCGHGLGRKFHEDPMVLHYAHQPAYPVRLKKGLTFTIEPMINTGSYKTVLQPDGWTVLTADGGLSAQFEHSLAVTEDGYEIFTTSPNGQHHPFI